MSLKLSFQAAFSRCARNLNSEGPSMIGRICRFSDGGGGGGSITYSGGQASAGQGGFYGSGGSRSVKGQVCLHSPIHILT